MTDEQEERLEEELDTAEDTEDSGEMEDGMEEMAKKAAEILKPKLVVMTHQELVLLYKLVDRAHRVTVEAGNEELMLKDMGARLESLIVGQTPSILCPCCGEDVLQPSRVLDKEGYVVNSIKKVYLLTEYDILAVAEEMDVKLTEEEVEDVARYVDKGLDPLGNWYEVIEEAIEELCCSV